MENKIYLFFNTTNRGIMSENTLAQETWKPSVNPWIMIIPVILAVFMFALDETVSNVALTYIAGSFSVSQN